MTSPLHIRAAAFAACAAIAATACLLFIDFAGTGGFDVLDVTRAVLIFISTFWLAWGSSVGIIGLVFRGGSRRVDTPLPHRHGRTAILVPIYNEDPVATFSRIAAINASLVQANATERFHIAILSDSNTPEAVTGEAAWFRRLLAEPAAAGRIFYRRRESNTGKKAGNIEDFIHRSGGAYDYALVLDADSLMEGATIIELARRMDADPDLGLLQTLPRIINARSFFGRCMQFSSNYLSPAFSRGLATLQGREGPFWGHNAIIRIPAFAASCGLPELSGKPPFGGHILSHDYVEAAMLARAGWKVRLDPDLDGSYEEGPENLVEYAKRDRRWCQGNLQHRKLIGAPGLRLWNRLTFLQGIMAYLASPIWLVLLGVSIVAAALPPGHYVPRYEIANSAHAAWNLAIGIVVLLLLPKVLILSFNAVTGGNRRFGGNGRALVSTLTEICYSTLLSPVMLLLQSRAVAQVLLGLDGGWPATQRSQSRIDLRDAWTAGWWMVVFGFATFAVVLAFTPRLALWVLPAVLPMMAAPLLITMGSQSRRSGRPLLFVTPLEIEPTPVMIERERILAAWTQEQTPAPERPGIAEADSHVRA